MTEVSKRAFFIAMGPLDVHLTVVGEWPYTTEYKLRNGALKGKVVDSFTDNVPNRRPIVTKYYVV